MRSGLLFASAFQPVRSLATCAKTNQAEAYRIMGADVRQTAEQFGNSAQYLRWQDREAD